LDDDDLTLIDPMFDAYVSEAALQSSEYAEMFNTANSHALSAARVHEKLARLQEGGLVTTNASGRYGLTPAGGDAWEKERTPNWDLYCVASEDWAGNELRAIEITAFSRDEGRRFLELSIECGLCPPNAIDSVKWIVPRQSRIYWKRDPIPWVAELSDLGPWPLTHVDRKRFQEQKRTWSEIGSLITVL
jgi:hypothetical protein